MPPLHDRLPAMGRNQVSRRQSRAAQLVHHTRILHAAMVVSQLRREERKLQREFWSQPLVIGDKAGPGLFVYDRLLRCRDKLFELVCYPKPPTLRPGQQPGQEVNRAGRIDLALAPADAVEVPVSPPTDSPAPPSDPPTP